MSDRKPAGRVASIKALVRERDGMRCVRCGLTNEEHKELTGKALHVHRLKPGAKYSTDGTITVCAACHGQEARRRKGEPDLELKPGCVRLSVEVSEEVRSALRLEAAMTGRSMADALAGILAEALAHRIEMVRAGRAKP